MESDDDVPAWFPDSENYPDLEFHPAGDCPTCDAEIDRHQHEVHVRHEMVDAVADAFGVGSPEFQSFVNRLQSTVAKSNVITAAGLHIPARTVEFLAPVVHSHGRHHAPRLDRLAFSMDVKGPFVRTLEENFALTPGQRTQGIHIVRTYDWSGHADPQASDYVDALSTAVHNARHRDPRSFWVH